VQSGRDKKCHYLEVLRINRDLGFSVSDELNMFMPKNLQLATKLEKAECMPGFCVGNRGSEVENGKFRRFRRSDRSTVVREG
jgi:hypothetical protein